MRVFFAALWAGVAAEGSWPPQQVALAAGDRGDSDVSITWITDDPRDDNASCAQVTQVAVATIQGISQASEVQMVGKCLRYSFGAAPELYGNYTSGRIHRVFIKGLVANSQYNYTLYGDPPNSTRSFKTLPASQGPAGPTGDSQDPRYPFVFGFIGDLGQTEHSIETVRHLDADKDIRIILHAGDMSYADTNAARWDSYGLKVEPLASRLQWMVCPGNHEIESDYYTGQNFQPYEARFVMPAVQQAEFSPSNEQIGCKHPYPTVPHTGNDCTPSAFTGQYDWGNSFYAFDAGPARVISLNSYAQTHPSSAQYKWLKQELEALEARRTDTPWLVVMMHCPFYNSNKAHQDEQQATLMRDAHGFEDLFHQHKVAVVISGHVHAYERSHPVYKNTSQPGAPTYLVVGDGGNREGHASTYLDEPGWSAFRDGLSFGHGRLVIANQSHMRWEWYRNDKQQLPRVDRVTAVRRAAELAHSSFVPLDAQWYQPLSARKVDDDVWILNPYKSQVQHKPLNASLLMVGLVAAVAVLAVASVLLVKRCTRRPAPCETESAEMGVAQSG